MPKPRGREHTTLTETATEVVAVLSRIQGVVMIAPGIIKKNGRASGRRFVTAVFTTSGMELIISGQSVQKVAVHVKPERETETVYEALRTHKRLAHISFKHRERKPGI
jgi:hypothetical protein